MMKKMKISTILFIFLYWGICTTLMIVIDTKGMLDIAYAWLIGAAMMAIYVRLKI